jgi:hypothetical protein
MPEEAADVSDISHSPCQRRDRKSRERGMTEGGHFLMTADAVVPCINALDWTITNGSYTPFMAKALG